MLTLLSSLSDSPEYNAFTESFGPRLACAAGMTLLAICGYVEKYGSSCFASAVVMECAQVADRRAKRKLLAAMLQCGLLLERIGGYGIAPCLTVDLDPVAPTSVLPRVDLDPLSAAQERPAPQLSTPATTQKAEQNQPSNLARACAASATVPKKAPPLDRASTAVEVEAGSVVRLWPLRAQAKKQASFGLAVDRQPVRTSTRCNAGDLVPVGNLFSTALENIVRLGGGEGSSTGDSDLAAPRGLVEEPDAPQRVKAHRVTKQQKDVNCRQPSSDAANLLPPEMLAMPTLFPDAAEIKRESARVWPHSPITGKLAETIMQQQTTRDELLTALAKVEKDIAAGRYKGPPVLIHVLGDVRQAREAESNKLFSQKRVADGGASTIRRAEIHQAICDYMGPERWRSHPDNTPYLLACDGHSQDEVVSLYTEMRGSEEDADWESVCMALAKGRQPRRTGILPAVSNEQLARAVFERFGSRERAPASEKTGMESVQSFLDKRERAS